MNRKLRTVSGLALLLVMSQMVSSQAQVPEGSADFPPFMNVQHRPDPRIQEFQNISRGARTFDGLFKLYQKEENVYAELLPHHLNKPYLLPIAIAKGAGLGGYTLNFDEQWVLVFKRVGEKVQVIRRNVHHKARSGSPTARAVDITYSDSILLSLRIAAINPGTQGVLINLNDIFMSDFAEIGSGIGHFDPSRSVWHKIKNFPKNLELEIEATYSGGRGGDDTTIDTRGTTIVIHYGIVELPDSGYHARIADDRVGHFLTAVKDFSSTSKDTAFVRYVNRWRLEPAEPIVPGKLSVPTRSIKFYIEKTVPHEYRAAVQEGILEWNKAFEKIGFRNAIEVVQQRDDEDFDPEDMNYNTFRWITTDNAFAMGPSRANPLTGEILDADIMFDADFIRYWKQERQIYRSNGQEHEIASPLQALDLGWGLDRDLLLKSRGNLSWDDRSQSPSMETARLRAIRQGLCQCRDHMKMELSMAALALAASELAPMPREAKDKDKKEEKDKIIDQLLNQAIKEVVMHEVGHTLGLRHNFKGSTMLPNNQLHDTKITHEKGLVGSVMDYCPVNLAPKGVKQGDFFTSTLGVYDYWAIEYAYKPLSGGTDGEVAELKKIAAKGASTPGLDYGTDEDVALTSDPSINRFDMGNDVMQFAQDRMIAADELMKELSSRVVEEGEGYQRARVAFTMLLNQYGNGAYLIARHIGGEHAYRDHYKDPKGRDPLVPVNTEKQRQALKFLQEQIFSDKSFQYSPELLRRLAVERWMHWGIGYSSTDFPLYDRVLGIQKVALNQLLSASVLQRVQANANKVDKDAKPLTVAEIFRSVSDGIWADLPKKNEKVDAKSSTIRRNLQREHVKKLSTMVLGEKPSSGGRTLFAIMEQSGGSIPPDARNLARFHLRELSKRIDEALKSKELASDEAVLAHLEECKERIAKVLSASMQVND